MSKYFLFAKGVFYEHAIYRFSFLIWRLRVVFYFLSLYFLWTALLPSGTQLFGYTQKNMLTYLFLGTIFGDVVFANRSASIGDEINNGNLSNHLLKPINYFSMWLSRDLGDKAINLIFSIAEVIILFILLKPPFFFQENPVYIGVSLVTIGIGIILFFLMNLLLGFLGFWTNEVWAPRFILMILVQFFAGGLFPLDILPNMIVTFFKFTPFPYLLFFPLKIYLGRYTYYEISQGIFIAVIWVGILYICARYMWKKGLKKYRAEGI